MIKPSPITDERIRERAYHLWVAEGRPEGRANDHWERARELLELEVDPEEGKEDPDEGYNHPGPWGEPVEEASILENLGEFPGMTDQGEQEIPRKRKPVAAKPVVAKPPAAKNRTATSRK